MKKLLGFTLTGLLILSGCGNEESADKKEEKFKVSTEEKDSRKEKNDKEKEVVESDEIKEDVKEGIEETSQVKEEKKEESKSSQTVANNSSSIKTTTIPNTQSSKTTNATQKAPSETKPSTSTPKTSAPASTPVPVPTPKPVAPAPKPVAPAPKPAPQPEPPKQSSTVTKVQNALPGGYTADSDGSSVIILKGGTQIASTLPGTVGFSASLSSSDMDAAMKGASGLGGNYSLMKSVVNTLVSGEAIASAGRTNGMKRSGMIFITW